MAGGRGGGKGEAGGFSLLLTRPAIPKRGEGREAGGDAAKEVRHVFTVAARGRSGSAGPEREQPQSCAAAPPRRSTEEERACLETSCAPGWSCGRSVRMARE